MKRLDTRSVRSGPRPTADSADLVALDSRRTTVADAVRRLTTAQLWSATNAETQARAEFQLIASSLVDQDWISSM
jgi:hypothetical protein